ncbi:NADH:ubiquinone oxidoreductase [bacterium]|nr:NADH:ubiquinone oxidoreductase [bacterium]
MKYLGIEPKRLRVGVFDFTSCEGCELQFANKEETLLDFLGAIDIVNFREISSDQGKDYDIAFVEGSITRSDEFARIIEIRRQAKILVALGSCACFGGVNALKNAYNLTDANREVYGTAPRETLPTRAIKEVVPVDMEIPGCPVNKDEVERIVQHLIWSIPFNFPEHPVCLECKQRFTTCVFEKGQLCLGPITRGGCTAPCPAGGTGCWGCRGEAAEPNFKEFSKIAHERGFSDLEISERMAFFGGFEGEK